MIHRIHLQQSQAPWGLKRVHKTQCFHPVKKKENNEGKIPTITTTARTQEKKNNS